MKFTQPKALLALLGAGVLAFSGQANAAFTIVLDSNANGIVDGGEQTIVDNGGFDASGTLGVISFNAGGVLSIVSTTKPAVGSASNPAFFGLAFSTDGIAAGTYGLLVSQTGFGPSGSNFQADLAFNPFLGAASLLYEVYTSSSNNLFALSDQVTSLTANTVTSEALQAVGSAPSYTSSGPYSITQRFVLTVNQNGTRLGAISDLKAVPDGGTTMALLGASLVSLPLLRRKFAK